MLKTRFKYFNLREFDSKGANDPPGTGHFMDLGFVDLLDTARCIAGIPFKINSGFRTVAHNKAVGGVPKSSHTLGYAADIACTDSRSRFLIVNALLKVGINRIIIYPTFIHCDVDPSKSANILIINS